jgi:HD-like signal output (HDOD) protein
MQLRNPACPIVPIDEAPEDPPSRFLARITEDIARGPINLPCFPDIVPQVRRALDDPMTCADDLVRIAGSEPRLSARLIQTAGSVVFNPSGRPPPNLRSAVTRLGHQLVQSVVMVFAVQQLKAEPKLRNVARPLGQLWEKSITVASICQTLARELHVPPDKVFLAGLVHGIGHFYILVRAVEEGSEVTYDQLPTGLIDARHPAIGRAVLTKWGFEPGVCEAVGRQCDYDRESALAADLTDVLIASIVLAEVMLEGHGDLTRCEHIASFDRIGFVTQELSSIIAHTEHTIGALRESLSS